MIEAPSAWLSARSAVLLAGLALPAMSVAADVDGLYKLSADADCSRVGEAGGALRISDGVLYGVESACRMSNPVSVRDMDASLFDMVCEGEGTEWVERALVMRGAEGQLILVWNGYAFAYPRCPDASPAPASTVRPRPKP